MDVLGVNNGVQGDGDGGNVDHQHWQSSLLSTTMIFFVFNVLVHESAQKFVADDLCSTLYFFMAQH